MNEAKAAQLRHEMKAERERRQRREQAETADSALVAFYNALRAMDDDAMADAPAAHLVVAFYNALRAMDDDVMADAPAAQLETARELVDQRFQAKMSRLGLYGRTVERLLSGFYDRKPRTAAELLDMSDQEVYNLAATRYG